MVGSQPLPPLVDRARKEELILQKQVSRRPLARLIKHLQVRQATSRILTNNQGFKQSQSNLRQSQSNLPTLIGEVYSISTCSNIILPVPKKIFNSPSTCPKILSPILDLIQLPVTLLTHDPTSCHFTTT